MNKISLISKMFFVLCMCMTAGCDVLHMCISTGCVLNFEPEQHYLGMYNRCTTPIEVQHNDGTGRVFTLDSGQIKSFIGVSSSPPADVIPTYKIDGKSYQFHLEEEYEGIYRYTACYDKSEPEGELIGFDNQCTTAIDAQHNDGTGRVFSLKPKEDKSFIVHGEYSPSYILKGKSYSFHKGEGFRRNTYTACYEELEQEYYVKFYNKCATAIEAQYNDGTISFSLEPEERAGYLISGKDSLSYTLKGKSYLFYKEKVGNLSNSYIATACYDE